MLAESACLILTLSTYPLMMPRSLNPVSLWCTQKPGLRDLWCCRVPITLKSNQSPGLERLLSELGFSTGSRPTAKRSNTLKSDVKSLASGQPESNCYVRWERKRLAKTPRYHKAARDKFCPPENPEKRKVSLKNDHIREIRAKLRVDQFPFGAVKGHSAVPRTDPHL